MRFADFLTDGVGPDWAQQIVASDLGMYYLLHYNHAIILDGYFVENCWFLG